MSELTVPAHLQKYVDYLNNVGQSVFPTADFDEDWEPVGPTIRAEMLKFRLIEEDMGAMALDLRLSKR